jgi:hypothetical protein
MGNTEVELSVTLDRKDIEFPIRDVFDRAHVMIRSLLQMLVPAIAA